MCDYSLQHVASRPAKIEDKLVVTEFTFALLFSWSLFHSAVRPMRSKCFARARDAIKGVIAKTRSPTAIAAHQVLSSPHLIHATTARAIKKAAPSTTLRQCIGILILLCPNIGGWAEAF
jgi:hypothetical protein